MGASVDAEQIETTRSEKALAVVLAVFILVGGLWAYFNLDDVDRPATRIDRAGSPADRAAIDQNADARREVRAAGRAVAGARNDLELAREAFRTALDAGRPSEALGRAFDQAQRSLNTATQDLRAAKVQVRATGPEAAAAETRARQVRDDQRRDHERLVFALRLALVLLMLGCGYVLLSVMRVSQSRYLPLALALIGAAAALALVMAIDYTEERIDIEQTGPLVLSLAGIALTVVAFVSLQRYVARRVPLRRVRRHECPFCGFPTRDNANCEGCGRRVVGKCSTCDQPRRVGTAHCGACGSA